jgi:hypothetical protein
MKGTRCQKMQDLSSPWPQGQGHRGLGLASGPLGDMNPWADPWVMAGVGRMDEGLLAL